MRGDVILAQDEIEEVRALYAALQDQRRADLERLRRVTTENDGLRADLADQLRDLRKAEARAKQYSAPNVLVRIGDSAKKGSATLVQRLLAALLLRLARSAVRNSRWAQAQVYYQCIAVLRPRIFLWKQVGNMLYQQKIHGEATALLEAVLEAVPDDAEAIFLLERCKEKLRD
ncbi:MAG: hypothetical protein J0I80_13800 [Sphingomonas sp.]|nr:hypothetical protein [Sphingomonas sp.]